MFVRCGHSLQFFMMSKNNIDVFVGVLSLDSSNMSLKSLFVFNFILSHGIFSFSSIVYE
jgi:hypothetical protein